MSGTSTNALRIGTVDCRGSTGTFNQITIHSLKYTVPYTYNTTLGTLPSTSRTAYTFNGWYTATSGGIKLSSSSTVTGNQTIYARWTMTGYEVQVHHYFYEGAYATENSHLLYDERISVTSGTNFIPQAVTAPYPVMRIYNCWDYANWNNRFDGTVGQTAVTVTSNRLVQVYYIDPALVS